MDTPTGGWYMRYIIYQACHVGKALPFLHKCKSSIEIRKKKKTIIHSLCATFTYLVANSTPIVVLLSRLKSFLVYLDSRLLFPTPESPINTTTGEKIIVDLN